MWRLHDERSPTHSYFYPSALHSVQSEVIKMDGTQPKLDMKMLVLPAVLYFSRSIDFKNPEVQQQWQQIFIAVMLGCLAVYFFIYTRLSNDSRKIWVPPKPKPQLPFGLGPPEEKLKPEDFKETTYREHEISLLKEAAQQLLTSTAISFFMGMQFKVYMSFLLQSITTPMGLVDNVLVKKYILGQTKAADGGELYNEQFKQPTVQSIEIAERLKAARAAGVGAEAAAAVTNDTKEGEETLTPSVTRSAIAETEPRVEELSEEKDEPASQ